MKITRDVILDLLPVYLSGEASPATRDLVEDYLRQDPELAERVRVHGSQGFPKSGPAPPPELELRSLHRTRRLLGVQKWLCALATTFTALSLTSEICFENRRVAEFHLLMRDYPEVFGTCLAIGLGCWIAYFSIRRRLRTSGAP